MLTYLRKLRGDISTRYGRFQYLDAVLRHIPGNLGMELRRRIIPKYFAACGKDVHISEGVRFRVIENIRLGNNVRIGIDNFIQAGGGVTLEDDVMLGPGVKIWSQNHRYDDVNRPIPDQGYTYDPVYIGKGVWIGADVFVLPGVTLPEGCVVSASSVVSKKNYKPYSILAGNPCRVIGWRKQ